MILENPRCSPCPSPPGSPGTLSPHGHPWGALSSFHIVSVDFRLLPRHLLPCLLVIMPGTVLSSGDKAVNKRCFVSSKSYTIVTHSSSSRPNHSSLGAQCWLPRFVIGPQLKKTPASVSLAYAVPCLA